jgi:high affinity Mn2+ porin
MSLPDTFDVNSVGSDSHLQFTNWTIDNNGAWDYAADTRGYTYAEFWSTTTASGRRATPSRPCQRLPTASTLTGPSAAPTGRTGSSNCAKGSSRLAQSKREGAVRVLSYVNHAHMGDYRESVEQYLAGPDRDARHHADRALRRGEIWLWLNTEQEVTDSLRLFGRFGWNEDQHESFAYTEVGQTILFGGDYNGQSWHRSNDKWAWRLFRTPSSATTRTICTTAGWAFCWATAT